MFAETLMKINMNEQDKAEKSREKNLIAKSIEKPNEEKKKKN